jgi:hypothetical protein
MLHVRLGVLDPGYLSPVLEFHFLKFQERGRMHVNQVSPESTTVGSPVIVGSVTVPPCAPSPDHGFLLCPAAYFQNLDSERLRWL